MVKRTMTRNHKCKFYNEIDGQPHFKGQNGLVSISLYSGFDAEIPRGTKYPALKGGLGDNLWRKRPRNN